MIISDYKMIVKYLRAGDQLRFSAPLITNDKNNQTHVSSGLNYGKKVLITQSGLRVYYRLYYNTFAFSKKYTREITKITYDIQ